MTTIVNSPSPSADSGGNSFLIGMVVIIGMVILFVYVAMPAFRRMGTPQVNTPTQVVVPDKIDVNVTNK